MLQTVIGQIVAWFVLRLNAIKAKITTVEQNLASLQGQFTSFVSATNTAIADRFTKAQSDARYLGVAAQAVDSAKLEGYTKAQILAEAEMSTENAVQALRATTQKDTIIVPLTPGGTYDLLTILGDANLTDDLQDDGTVFVTFNGPFSVTGSLTAANGSPMGNGGNTQAVKTGDQFVIKLTDGVPVSVQYAPSAVKAAIDALNTTTANHENRITTLEDQFGDIDGTFATDASVDDKVLAAFQNFYDQLTNSGYSDPN